MPDENFITRVSAASNKLVAASNSSVRWSRAVRETLSSAAKKSRFSRADKRGKKDRSVATAKLTWRRTSEAFVCVSASLTTTRPESGSKTVEINFRAVVFPLPFGPRRTKILPVGIGQGHIVEGKRVPRALAAHPVKKGWPVPKDLRNGLEADAQRGLCKATVL
jgi:hypothetical protein